MTRKLTHNLPLQLFSHIGVQNHRQYNLANLQGANAVMFRRYLPYSKYIFNSLAAPLAVPLVS